MEYKDNLINFDLKSFLDKFSKKDIIKLKDKYPENYILLSEQLKLYPKARQKLPLFSENCCFFTSKGYEQASSEKLAQYKAGLFKGETMLDLTGGLGIDDWAFSKKFTNVVSVDSDIELNKLARINFAKLGLTNIERIDAYAEEFINKINFKADLVFIDADRRSKNKKTVTLEEASPQVLKILPGLTEISTDILLKLSPLTDITYILKALKNIMRIYVISLENETKEILVYIKTGYDGNAIIEAIDISKPGTFIYSASAEINTVPLISSSGKFFYEPSNSLIKAGLTASYAAERGLKQVSNNSVYLVSDTLIKDFFGRKFKVISTGEFSKSQFKKYLAKNNIHAANLSARNFPLKAEEISRMFKLKDGGEDYFFFTQLSSKQKVYYHCRKIKSAA